MYGLPSSHPCVSSSVTRLSYFSFVTTPDPGTCVRLTSPTSDTLYDYSYTTLNLSFFGVRRLRPFMGTDPDRPRNPSSSTPIPTSDSVPTVCRFPHCCPSRMLLNDIPKLGTVRLIGLGVHTN